MNNCNIYRLIFLFLLCRTAFADAESNLPNFVLKLDTEPLRLETKPLELGKITSDPFVFKLEANPKIEFGRITTAPIEFKAPAEPIQLQLAINPHTLRQFAMISVFLMGASTVFYRLLSDTDVTKKCVEMGVAGALTTIFLAILHKTM